MSMKQWKKRLDEYIGIQGEGMDQIFLYGCIIVFILFIAATIVAKFIL